LLAALGILLAAAPAALAAPFACTTPTVFVSLSEGGDPTQLNSLTTTPAGSSVFTPIGTTAHGRVYNAIGFNPDDNFIYGTSNGHIVRIDSAGTVTDVRILPPGLNNVGAFDGAGNYYFMSGAQTTLFKVDISTMALTSIALSQSPDAADLTFIAGSLWGATSDAGPALVRVNPSTGAVDKFPTSLLPGSFFAGAAWTYGNGNLGLSLNEGGIYQLRITAPASPAPTFSLVAAASGPTSDSNDGTSCAGLPADLRVTKSGPTTAAAGATITWTVTVSNVSAVGNSSGYVLNDTVPAGVGGVATSTPGCSLSGNAVQCIGTPLNAGQSRPIVLTGTAPSIDTTLVNSATVIGNEADPIASNDSASATTVVQSTASPTPPDTAITSGPDEGSTTNDSTPVFGYTSDQAGSTFACEVDSSAFSCTSPRTIGPLSPGSHVFRVAATNPGGLTDPTPAERHFIVNAPPDWIAPTPADGSEFTVNTGQQVTLTVSALDPDALDQVAIGAGTRPTGSTVTSVDGNPALAHFSWTPTQPGAATLRFSAVDNHGLQAKTLRIYTFHVLQANRPPVVNSGAPDATNGEGQTLSTSGSFSDPDGDALVVTADNTAGTFVGSPDGSWSWTLPTNDEVGPRTITVTATDPFGGSASDTFTYQAFNRPPIVTLSNPPRIVDEGPAEVTISYTIADPGSADTVASVSTFCGQSGVWIPGSDVHTDHDGSFRCVFPDGPGVSTAIVRAIDNDGLGGNQAEFTIGIRNVAPTALLSSGNDTTVDEGPAAHVYAFTVSDPGVDTISVVTSCGSAGTKVPGSDTATSFACVFPDGPASSTVSVTPTDSDGASGPAATQVVAVRNLPPAVRLSGANDTTVDEGPGAHTYAFTVSDPGEDTIGAPATSCGTAGTKVAGSDTATSFACVFPDGPASSTVSVSATDSDGATGSDGQAVTVRNVPPTATLSAANDRTVDEGPAQHTYAFTISDPGQDTISSIQTSCGTDGTKVAGSDTATSFACVFPDGPASAQVSVRATDSDGDTGPGDMQTVTVRNVPPTTTLDPANDRLVDEGPAQHTYRFTVTDPGQDTVQSIDASCGTGGALVAGSETASSFRCVFPDGPATTTVSVAATDSDGDTGPANTQVVTVRNVPPTATFDPGNDTVVNGGGGAQVTFRFSVYDPGVDTIQAIHASCGTGGTVVAGSVTETSFKCVFSGTGFFTVSVSATDSDGDTGPTDTEQVLVYAFPGNGKVSFVISDKRAVVNGAVMFWGAQWSKENPFNDGGSAPNAFKGFAEQFSGASAPSCGATWTTGPGNSSGPPSTIPTYMGVVAASAVTKSGSTISGDVKRIVVVKADPGYGPSPGHEGTAKVIAVDCG
jgi:uncharacterized repeat protein (TIGR01451 family)